MNKNRLFAVCTNPSAPKRWQRRLACAMGALGVAVAGLVGGPVQAQDKKPYVIYLSNNYVGNDWRQQMLRVAQVSVRKGPLAGRVDLRIENVESTVQAQINSLNNIIRQKPDAIIVDAASDSALNPTVKRACDAGIVVVSFDQPVTEPCAYTVTYDWNRIPEVMAEWMAKQLNGKGNVFLDRGLAGAPISTQITGAYEKVLAQYPDINIVGQYNGDYAVGQEQSGVAALLAANPQVDGILTQGYGAGAIQALKNAERPMVPITAFAYNGAAVACAQTAGAQCILGYNSSYLSAEALKLAVEILDTGKKPAQREIFVKSSVTGEFLTTDPFESARYPGTKMVKLSLGENAYPDLTPGLSLPVSPDWLDITAQEAAGSN